MGLSAELQDILDPSITRLSVFWEQPDTVPEQLSIWHYRGRAIRSKRRFWELLEVRWPEVRPDWTPDPCRLELPDPPDEEASPPLIPEERLEQLQNPERLNLEQQQQNIPYAITAQMAERSPQFTLRNLARLERYTDLSRPIRFEVEEIPLEEAEGLIDEVRAAHIPKIEFSEAWSAPLLDDFRIFLEEILYLCPWEQMPRGRQAPPEGSLWSAALSRSTLTHDLIAKRDIVFVWGHGGGPTTLARDAAAARRRARAEAASDSEPMG